MFSPAVELRAAAAATAADPAGRAIVMLEYGGWTDDVVAADVVV